MPLAKYAAPGRALQGPSSGYAAFLGKLNPYGRRIAENLKKKQDAVAPCECQVIHQIDNSGLIYPNA